MVVCFFLFTFALVKYVDVIMPLPLDGLFTYAVPASFADRLQVGHRVLVPFGRNKTCDIVFSSRTVSGLHAFIIRKDSGYYKATYGHQLTSSELNANALYTENLLNKANVAKGMVAKWFNMQGTSIDDAVFNTPGVFIYLFRKRQPAGEMTVINSAIRIGVGAFTHFTVMIASGKSTVFLYSQISIPGTGSAAEEKHLSAELCPEVSRRGFRVRAYS